MKFLSLDLTGYRQDSLVQPSPASLPGRKERLESQGDMPLASQSLPPAGQARRGAKNTISCKEHSAEIDGENGRVVAIDGKKVSLGLLKFNGVPFEVENIFSKCNKLCLSGKITGSADVTLEYFFGTDSLFCEVSAGTPSFIWPDTKISWGSCVYLEHSRDAGSEIIRNVSGVSQATGIEKFHSLDFLEIQNNKQTIRLRHGGNIFFRQTANTVQNRLWCYDEFCSRFWWAVETSYNPD